MTRKSAKFCKFLGGGGWVFEIGSDLFTCEVSLAVTCRVFMSHVALTMLIVMLLPAIFGTVCNGAGPI